DRRLAQARFGFYRGRGKPRPYVGFGGGRGTPRPYGFATPGASGPVVRRHQRDFPSRVSFKNTSSRLSVRVRSSRSFRPLPTTARATVSSRSGPVPSTTTCHS